MQQWRIWPYLSISESYVYLKKKSHLHGKGEHLVMQNECLFCAKERANTHSIDSSVTLTNPGVNLGILDTQQNRINDESCNAMTFL